MFKSLLINQKRVLIASLLIYAISLSTTAFTYNDINGIIVTSGMEAFFMGGLAILGGGLFEWILWLANPIFFISIFFTIKGKNRRAKPMSVIAVLIALSFLTWKNVLAAEDGRTGDIQTRGLGYFLWLLSMTIWSISVYIPSDIRAIRPNE
jgi:hypothetical protein